MVEILFLPVLAGISALIFSGLLIRKTLREDAGSKKMKEIAEAISEGAMAYLNRQYRTIAVFALILFIILWKAINFPTALGFITGAVLSAMAGYAGMNISVRANVRTANAASKGLKKALEVAFRGGAVTGMIVVGLSLLGVSIFYYVYRDPLSIVGLGFGASLISLFARIGGGIYTKAADVGADLVGKIDAEIPEDDPRNPAVIADNVGDNVGDCAGMAADLFETYVVTAIAAMLLGSIIIGSAAGIVYPLILGAGAIVASIAGTMFVKLGKSRNIMRALYKGVTAAGIIAAVLFYYITKYMLEGVPELAKAGISYIDVYMASLVGLGVTIVFITITEYYTSTKYKPVKSIARASKTGAGTNIITGLAVGYSSTTLPVLAIAGGMLLAYGLAGMYGIAIAAMAMLSVTGMIIALDAYGPITDNAGGIAEMSKLSAKVRKITDELDAVGNTTKAVTKGYAIGSAGLAALVLFAAYTQEIEQARIAAGISEPFIFLLNNPVVLAGLFIGALIPFMFSSLCMSAVGSAAHKIVEEVRRQFREIPGIMKGTAKPDYAKCVDIVTLAALKKMSTPALIAVISPIAVGMILGPLALGGLLIGSILSGLLLAITMTNGGGAWDNAKKYIEEGNYGGKNSDAYKAAVVGDTVGDPYKDTVGPAINPLIKVMNTIALIFAAIIVNYGMSII